MWHKLSGELLTTLGMCKRRQLAADSAPNTYLPSMAMTTRLLTEGDVERGHPPDLTMFVDAHGWSRVPGTDIEVRALADKPLALRYRPSRRA